MSFMTTNKILVLYGKYIIYIMTSLVIICFSATTDVAAATTATDALTNNI